jgi:TolA-binding protein
MVSPLAREIWKISTARSMEELARHYRRVCKIYHPDLQAPDQRAEYERHMQAINEAYSKALERFNIFTFKNPRQQHTGKQTNIHADLLADQPQPSQPRPRTPEQPAAPGQSAAEPRASAFATGEAARALGRALAILNGARTFNSFKAVADEKERHIYHQALPLLHDVARRFSSLREGQDALFYSAVCECNLRSFSFALHAFHQYRSRYPGDRRAALLHFYCGVCHHRLGRLPEAIQEYEAFLRTQPTGMFKHFLVVVAGYLTTALRGETPEGLPYA